MIRTITALAAFILLSHVAPVSGAETLGCAYKEAFKGGGWRDAAVTLNVEGGDVTAISYLNGIASGKEGGGYACAFDASVSDGKSAWTKEGKRTAVVLKGDKNSTFEIRRSKKGFTIRFLEMSTEHCGFGAEFPESVTLDRSKKKCLMKY